MNYRKWLLFSIFGIRGIRIGKYYNKYTYEFQNGIAPDTTRKLLAQLLQHCQQNVPYYSKIMDENGVSFNNDPIEYLKDFPVLTKDTLRRQFNDLKSMDLHKRRWYLNSTGGSTGEPAQFIQDLEYTAWSGAIKSLYSRLVGKDIGEREVRLWGNLHDIERNSEGWRAKLINKLENATFENTILMTPLKMREHLSVINTLNPKLIVSYAQAIFELAKFAEREDIPVVAQSAIMTSASKLYPFMREKIEKVFQCAVYDRYGSREVGDIACERPDFDGLWVAPWGNYLEIVDPEGNQVPDGAEGEILVTSLSNYAMPLIRYKIGDRGVFVSSLHKRINKYGQVLREVIGRTMDLFITKDGNQILSGFFMANLFFREWIAHYQIIQKSYTNIIYRIVKISDPLQSELDEITAITRKAMGNDCQVTFEFVDTILPTASGKYRFLISEVV